MKLLNEMPEDFVLAQSVFDFLKFDQINGHEVLYKTEFIIKGRSNIELYELEYGMSYEFLKPYLKNKQLYVRKS